jgi:hypothetical protein
MRLGVPLAPSLINSDAKPGVAVDALGVKPGTISFALLWLVIA